MESGKVKSIGVSNFTKGRVEKLLKEVRLFSSWFPPFFCRSSVWLLVLPRTMALALSSLSQANIKPAVNQIELSLHCAQLDFVKVCSRSAFSFPRAHPPSLTVASR